MKGIEIRYRREQLGLTQEELAEKLGVTRRTLLSWEQMEVLPKSKENLLKGIFPDIGSKVIPLKHPGDDGLGVGQKILLAIGELSDVIRRDNDAIARGVTYTFKNTEELLTDTDKILKSIKSNSESITMLSNALDSKMKG